MPTTRAEGYWGLEQWEEANEQFRLATQPANSKPLYKVRWGMLLHERFNDCEAADLFREALAEDPSNAQAYLGLATVSAESFSGKAAEYALKAIELDPKLAEAHELLADLALANDDREMAAAEADKAIALESDALDAMAIHAALELIADRSPEAWLDKIRAINPNYGEAIRARRASARTPLPLPGCGHLLPQGDRGRSAPVGRAFRAGNRTDAARPGAGAVQGTRAQL